MSQNSSLTGPESTGVLFDFIVVGAGTNGLVAASYLCKSGYSVLVLERQNYIGGAAITQELSLPGFYHDVFATSINVWRMGPVQKDLELEKYGYKDIDPDPVASTPFKKGKALSIYRDIKLTLKSISQFSFRDALEFQRVYDSYVEARDILGNTLFSPPLAFSDMAATLEASDTGLDFLQFSYMSVRDWVEETFESDEMRAFLTLWACNHSPLSPEEPRGALLAQGFVGSLQLMGVGVPVGGMCTLVNALRSYIEQHGGRVLVAHEVAEILVTRERMADGVVTKQGRKFFAKNGIIANVEPKSLFLKLVPEWSLDSEFKDKVKRYRFSKVGQIMIHAALDEWLEYNPIEIRSSGMVQIGESLDEISRSYNDCVIGRMPDKPFMTIDNTTWYDKSRAPSGKHIMWNYARAPVFISNRPWTEDEKERFADKCIERLSEYAPNSKKIILKRVVLSPQDIEAINPNLVNGDSGGGKPSLDQALALRPFPNWSSYRTPIRGLYICGPATHPGGGVSGASGHNAAEAALSDLISATKKDS
ncbi:MAG: NAD(P)/FAD-dependent oxidoreductase [Nitrososphaerota archaeon]|nr:NAD(P)/FAD-dependent oxidoreductase [Nitrososphaerota archaeon]